MNDIVVNGILRNGDKKYDPGYLYWLDVERRSGTVDTLMVLSPDGDLPEGGISIAGTVKAEYIRGVGVPVFIVPDEFSRAEPDGTSDAEVEGILKADPVLRSTKGGLSITTMLLMTDNGQIPVLLWGNNAKKAPGRFKAGDRVRASGRIQSRTYPGRDGTEHTTWELSAKGAARVIEEA